MKVQFDDLLDDILINILSSLRSPDILNVRLVCKRLETISRESGVWYDVFEREVISSGKPCPGFSQESSTFLDGQVSVPSSTPASGTATPQRCPSPSPHSHFQHIHPDLEIRTKRALRLEQRWKKRRNNSEDNTTTTAYELPEAINDVFLLRGGRFAVTVHADRLHCWDLGFPDADGDPDFSAHTEPKYIRCIDEWTYPVKGGHSAKLDTDSPNHWRAAEIGRIAIVRRTDSARRNLVRLCTVLSARCSSTVPENSGFAYDSEAHAHSGLLRQEAVVKLPAILPSPICSSSDDRAGSRSANGKLGNLLHMHGNLLFFESFAVGNPCFDDVSSDSEEEGVESQQCFVGIEVVNLSATASGNFVSALLEYPDSREPSCFDIHVHDTAEHIVVIWRNIIALYPIHEQLTCSELGFGEPPRIVLTPSTIVALTEELQRPITFTTCRAQRRGTYSKEDVSHVPEPLTILARSGERPQGLIQRVLFAIREPAFNPSTSSESGYESKFMLMRIPMPTPPQYIVPEFMPLNMDNTAEQDVYGVKHLVLGSSGRGIRVDASGAVFRCAPSMMALPGWHGGGLVTTVDFWPHTQSDTLPIPFSPVEEVHRGQLGGWTSQPQVDVKVGFDDGMGRLIAAHTLRSDAGNMRGSGDVNTGQGESGSVSRSVLTVMDFA